MAVIESIPDAEEPQPAAIPTEPTVTATAAAVEEETEKQPMPESAAVADSDEDTFEDALTDEQLRERALCHANESKAEGNELLRVGKYDDALLQYEVALQIASEVPSSEEISSMCHANRALCFLKLRKYNDTIKECTKALELNPSYVKALLRRGEAHEKLENFEGAIADMKKVLELEPSDEHARKSIRRLEPLAEAKREKMKEEMFGKLKDLGNTVLGKFGMSVDNFKAVKDPSTGQYSISFQK